MKSLIQIIKVFSTQKFLNTYHYSNSLNNWILIVAVGGRSNKMKVKCLLIGVVVLFVAGLLTTSSEKMIYDEVAHFIFGIR